jgi:hypothetical protein
MFQVEVFWVVTLCSVVVGYRRFRGPCCLLKIERWYPTTTLQPPQYMKLISVENDVEMFAKVINTGSNTEANKSY